jgi:dTMP kinase
MVNGVKTRLSRLGCNVVETKEPSVSQIGQFAKNAEEKYRGLPLACLISADRYFHIENEVIPALSEGKVILSDRYAESSLVLQRHDGVNIDFIWALNSYVYVPHLSIILLAKPQILEERLAKRRQYTRFEKSISRIDELSYYQDAADFLALRGFNIRLIDNDDTISFDTNIDCIVEEIESLRKKAAIEIEQESTSLKYFVQAASR